MCDSHPAEKVFSTKIFGLTFDKNTRTRLNFSNRMISKCLDFQLGYESVSLEMTGYEPLKTLRMKYFKGLFMC